LRRNRSRETPPGAASASVPGSGVETGMGISSEKSGGFHFLFGAFGEP
jgi:hypothetical protein